MSKRIDRRSWVLYGFLALVATSLLISLAWTATRKVMAWRALTVAKYQLQESFAALASDTLEPYRHGLVSENGCPVMLSAFIVARRLSMAEWASEACIRAGHSVTDAYSTLARSYQYSGRGQEALQVLTYGAQRFPDVGRFGKEIATLLASGQDRQAAKQAYRAAIPKAKGDPRFKLAALEFFLSQNEPADASATARSLIDEQVTAPGARMLMARALLLGGDKDSALAVFRATETAIAALEQRDRDALKSSYKDVFHALGAMEAPGK